MLSDRRCSSALPGFAPRLPQVLRVLAIAAMLTSFMAATSQAGTVKPLFQMKIGYSYLYGLGSAPRVYTISAGALPPGVTLSFNGMLSAIPTQPGTYYFTVLASAPDGRLEFTQEYSSVILPASLKVLTAVLPAAKAGVAYSQIIRGSGGTPPYTVSLAAGTLPAGMTLTPAGVLSGSPSAAGSFPVEIRVTDSANPPASATRSFPLTVQPGFLEISTVTLPAALVGSAYSGTVAAAGGIPPYRFSLQSGVLPAGLTLNPVTGQISGTPTLAGTSLFTVQATDAANSSALKALTLATTAAGDSIALLSPLPNAFVSGTYTFSARVNGSSTAYVEYRLNGQPLTTPLGIAPFSYTWHTGSVWDGPASVQAIARNRYGVEVARSQPVPFTIRNGIGSISLLSPNPAAPASGQVNWTVTGQHPHDVGGTTFVLNGNFNAPFRSTEPLDTTRLRNGSHDLFAGLYTNGSGAPPYAMLRVQLQVENGRVPMELRNRWSRVHLSPGQTLPLETRMVHTDGSSAAPAAGLTHRSSSPGVVSVDAGGQLRGVAQGVATITSALGSRTASTLVFVSNNHGLPHFGRDGRVLSAYDPQRSLFVRTVIALDPDEIRSTPGLQQKVEQAGLNALTMGFYLNPLGTGNRSLDDWFNGWSAWFETRTSLANEMNMALFLIGDDVARTPAEMGNTLFGPWSASALQRALTSVRDSGIGIAIDMVDEVNFLWGEVPKPRDGRWLSSSPPIPDDAFVRLMNILNAVPNRPSVSWPVAGLAGPPEVRDWLGDASLSNHSSHYWTFMDWRYAYPTAPSLPQYHQNMDAVTIGRLPLIQWSKPSMLLTSLTGPSYTKLAANTQFRPGVDGLQHPAAPAKAVSAQIFYAIATGQAGVRFYAYDSSRWKEERLRASFGQRNLQTGSDPFLVGTDRWHALSAAFNTIKQLEPHFLQTQVHAPDLGSGFTAGARQGPNSRVLVAVNLSERTQEAAVDLRSYLYAGATKITRYHVTGGSAHVDKIQGATVTDTVDFAPGEAIVWLFTPAGDTAPSVALMRPMSEATVSGTVAVEAAVADPANLDRVEFSVDGAVIGTVRSAPFVVNLNTAGLNPQVWHAVAARAYDRSGRVHEARRSILTQ